MSSPLISHCYAFKFANLTVNVLAAAPALHTATAPGSLARALALTLALTLDNPRL